MFTNLRVAGVLCGLVCVGCDPVAPAPEPAPGGSGGSVAGTGGSGGSGGDSTGGTGGAPAPDAAPPPPPPPPPPTGDGGVSGGIPDPKQGPIAEGKSVFWRDFDDGTMTGMSRSPNGLPEDRVQIVDDPIKERGKVVRIHYQAGDNFRTSGGTQPRSWFSSAMGYTIRPGTTVSISWGFMWENVNMGAHFAQIIRDGGPLWMFDVDGSGNVKADVHRGSGSTGNVMKLEPMKWYNFRVDTEYKGGGAIRFYINDKMVGQGRGDGGAAARWDCGTYWGRGAKATRTVYLSNLSIAEQ